MRRTFILSTALAATFGAVTGFAAAGDETTLSIGDRAPTIDIAHWIKGVEVTKNKMTPLTDFEEGKVYVLEFWATWCGPCKAGMPHLSKLQEQYKDYDVSIIGVSDEQLPTVVNFLFETYPGDNEVQNDRTNYILATDPDESVKTDYFRAAGLRGIPSAFIIGKDSKIEWIGHPMDMDEPLGAVVHGTWDRQAFKTKYDAAAAAERKLQGAYKEKDWDTVLRIYDDKLQDKPGDTEALMGKFNVLLLYADRPSEAYVAGHTLMKQKWDEAGMLNALAWTVADDSRVTSRDLGFALKAAKRANELTDSADPAILDTLARVYYEQGDLRNAIKFQRLAADHAGDNRMGEEIRSLLKKYEDEAK